METISKMYEKETEESVIAHLISNPDSYDEVKGKIDADSFGDESCKMLFKAIDWSFKNGNVPDFLYLQSLFARHGRDFDKAEVERIHQSPISMHLGQQIDILEEYRKRRIYRDLRIALATHEGGDTADLDKLVDAAIQSREKMVATNILDKYALMNCAAELIDENRREDRPSREVMTGFRIIDDQGGIPPESEVILAAFSSQGKSSLAMCILDNAMKNGVSTALFSAEMGKLSIAGRFLNMNGWGVPIPIFKTKPLMDHSVDDFNRIAQDFVDRQGNIYLDDSSNNDADYICSSIRVMHKRYGVTLAVVDYLQIIALYGDSADSDQQKLASASRKFQQIAKELGIAIIVLSQFSRPSKNEGHLPSEDLIRGSGQIYEACDIAMYVYRPEKWEDEKYPAPFQDAEKKNTAMIKIGKFRDGESGGSEIVGFDGRATKFYEFTLGMYDEDPKKNYPKAASLPLETENNAYHF